MGILLVISIFGMCQTAWALRCKGRIVGVGDSESKVLRICGEPDRITEWREPVVETVYDPDRKIHIEHKNYIIDHVWTYKFGSGRLEYILIFHDHKLRKIRTRNQQ